MSEPTTQEIILAARRTMSRRAIAEITGLTEGKIWRIETKGTCSDEEAVAVRRLVAPAGETPAESSSPEVPPVAFQAPETPAEPPPPPPEPPLATEPTPALVEPVQDEVVPPFRVPSGASEAAVTAVQLPDFADGRRRISNSELSTFRRCRRKWWLTYHRGLRPKSEYPIGARAVGDRGHRALRRYYVADPSQRTDPRDALEREIHADWSKLWLHFRLLGFDEPPAEDVKLFKRSVDLERVIIDGYVQWLAETGADSQLTVVSSETYVEAELPDTNVLLIGKLDVRLRRAYDRAILFADHKFVGSIPQAVRLLPMNSQMKLYVWLEWQNAGDGERVVGALYNMLRRVKRTATATPPFYERVEQHHNPQEITNFELTTRGTVVQIQTAETYLNEPNFGFTTHEVAYPSPTPDCAWDCPFVQVCPMFDDGSRVEDALQAHFIAGDPYDYYRRELVT